MPGSLGKSLCSFFLVTMALAAAPAKAEEGYVQCAPFARQYSGIQLFGDAAGWWQQASGRYARGHAPQVGSVLVFKASDAMPIGHVAVVSGVVGDREIRVTHANWSNVDGRRGQVERDVSVVDVSDAGDWSSVRVWYAPTGKLGSHAYAVYGFVYGRAQPSVRTVSASVTSPDPLETLIAEVVDGESAQDGGDVRHLRF